MKITLIIMCQSLPLRGTAIDVRNVQPFSWTFCAFNSVKGIDVIMKKDVLISIKGVYDSEDNHDEVELFTTGTYYKKDGCYFICYDETEATGFEGSKTTLRVDDQNMVTLERTGKAKTQLIVQRGVRHQCHYDTAFGDLMIGVSGSSIKSSLGDKGGNIEIKYSLDVNSMLASENEMYVNVKETGK